LRKVQEKKFCKKEQFCNKIFEEMKRKKYFWEIFIEKKNDNKFGLN